jgi:thiol:disulfide interchange protein DsbD
VIAVVILLCVIGISAFAPGQLAAEPGSQTGLNTQQQWEPWSQDAVSKYQAQGRPVFVDFTASWCLSCQVNERVALSQPAVKQTLQSANVALLKADWTRHDEAITQALAALDRSGVPAYALYAPGQSEPQMLPEVLTPGIVIEAVGKLRPAVSSAAQSSNSN